MKILPTSIVRKDFADTLNQVVYLKEHIILERHGKEIAALIPIDEFKKIEKVDQDSLVRVQDGKVDDNSFI